MAGVWTEEQEPEPEQSHSWLRNPLLCPVRDRGGFTSVITTLFRSPNCGWIIVKNTYFILYSVVRIRFKCDLCSKAITRSIVYLNPLLFLL